VKETLLLFFFPSVLVYHYFTASLNALAGLNFGVNLVVILTASPVLGFLPFHAFLLIKIKMPKPRGLNFNHS
jgi:hypothetical protein